MFLLLCCYGQYFVFIIGEKKLWLPEQAVTGTECPKIYRKSKQHLLNPLRTTLFFVTVKTGGGLDW